MVVYTEDKCKFMNINSSGNESVPLTYNQKNIIYINESGLHTLILRSSMVRAKEFEKWITNNALPVIRKNGKYKFQNKKYEMLTFSTKTEYDLYKKVVNFIRNSYSKALLIPTLGENHTIKDTKRAVGIYLLVICILNIMVFLLNLKHQEEMVLLPRNKIN